MFENKRDLIKETNECIESIKKLRQRNEWLELRTFLIVELAYLLKKSAD